MPDTAKPSIHVFGRLEPLCPSPGVGPIDLLWEAKDNTLTASCSFGRYENNKHVLQGEAVSGLHATIDWNGRKDPMSIVTITDYSVNGTFVDEEKVGQTVTLQLFDGSTVYFGSQVRIRLEQADYRYTFHHYHGRSKTESVYTHYTIGRQLGSGAFGTVFKATQKVSGSVFAIKTSWNTIDMGRAVLCAAQEAMAMMKLEHENICKLHEVFFRLDGEIADMVLEYVDGVTLDVFFDQSLSELHAKELSYQLCAAFRYVHREGVSHGDIKPNNILVAGTVRPVIKVADFGLARIKGNMNMTQLVTDHAWTAPEARQQILTHGDDVTVAMCSDWDSWAIGCIIYQLLCAKPPFRSSDPQHMGFRPNDDSINWAPLDRCSAPAQHLVKELLVEDPAHRFQVIQALGHAWLAGYVPYQVAFNGVRFTKLPAPGAVLEGTPDTSGFVDGQEEGVDVDAEGEDEDEDDMDMDVEVEAVAVRARHQSRQPPVRRRVQPRRGETYRSKAGPQQLVGRPTPPARKRAHGKH
ncbi:kinase-like domain-containing protein [Mycena rosella]|uniref:non-specific serine/threonine protein kinase n=1 Tax=Mycena rosella TaxID=1033263 RepID=A0AAD7GDA2_MYCRO|nr:kinase-like domain-containing protein [Mycena rosella]